MLRFISCIGIFLFSDRGNRKWEEVRGFFQRNGGVDVALQDRDQKKELTNQSAGSASPQRSSPGCTS